MKIEFDVEARVGLQQAASALVGSIVDLKDEQGEVSGKLMQVQLSADADVILMIARPTDNDWTKPGFGAPVPCVLTEKSTLFVY